MEDFPKPIKIKIFYDKEIKEITGKDSEEAIVSEGSFMSKLLKRPQKGKRRWGLASRLEHRRVGSDKKRR